jgi:hypothetical protein
VEESPISGDENIISFEAEGEDREIPEFNNDDEEEERLAIEE